MNSNVSTQGLGLLIICTLLMFIAVGVMAFIIYKRVVSTDPTKADTSIDPNITTAQEFVQFQNIKDGVIDLGCHRYRAILECSSVNYHLKTPTEKEMIEVGYEQFINSLKFPITMFIQTRVIDSTYVARTLEKDMNIVRKKFPDLESYMNLYLDSMKNLNYYLPNTKHKKKYVIIPFEDSYLMPELSDSEKYDYSLSELRNRADIIKRGLEGVGINCKLLDTRDTIEMVYAAYHKEHFSPDKIDAIVNEDFFSLLTTGENRYSRLTSSMKMDLILNEAQNKIRKDILLSMDIDNTIKEIYKDIYKDIDNLRDKVGGYYKEGQTKLNLYENNISRYNFETIKESTGLTDIKEEEIKIRKNYSNHPTHNNSIQQDKSIILPKYEQDSYEEHGYLDKYDKKKVIEDELERESKKYEEAFKRAHIHKSEFGIITDNDMEENLNLESESKKTKKNTTTNKVEKTNHVKTPIVNKSIDNNLDIDKKENINAKKTSIQKSEGKKTKKNITTNKVEKTNHVKTPTVNKSIDNNLDIDKKEVINKENNIDKQNHLNQTKYSTKEVIKKSNYYDENISNNNIPNFEVKVKELENSKLVKSKSKSLDDLSKDFIFNDDENDTPNNRTRDLSFFDNKNNNK